MKQIGFDPSLIEVRQDRILLFFRSVNRGNSLTILCEHKLKHVITFKFRLKNLVSQTVGVRLFALPTVSSPHSYSNLGIGSSSINWMFGLLDEVMFMRPLVVSFNGNVLIVRIWCFTLCCTSNLWTSSSCDLFVHESFNSLRSRLHCLFFWVLV